jgi:hypothetical protein
MSSKVGGEQLDRRALYSFGLLWGLILLAWRVRPDMHVITQRISSNFLVVESIVMLYKIFEVLRRKCLAKQIALIQ